MNDDVETLYVAEPKDVVLYGEADSIVIITLFEESGVCFRRLLYVKDRYHVLPEDNADWLPSCWEPI